MNTATQTMPSPVSPYNPQSKQSYLPSQQRSYYPPAPSTETMSPRQGPNRGLGLYSMAPSHQPLVSPMMASPQSEPWSQSPSMEQEYPTASNRPDIFSAAIDPFSGFPGSTTSDMVSGQSPEAPALEYSPPPSSNVQSHRGSISSYAPSDSSECAYTPRVKGEDSSEWYTPATSEHVLQRNVAQAPVAYTPGSATLPSQTEDLYRPSQSEDVYRNQHADWSKADTASCVSEMRASADGRIPHFEMQPILPSASRIKKKRQRTTPEEATHECGVCGKFFKRSYNWKSHLETHNPDRKYPHPCTAMAGDVPCTKKFQRKTDLDRHNDSVRDEHQMVAAFEQADYCLGSSQGPQSQVQSLRQ